MLDLIAWILGEIGFIVNLTMAMVIFLLWLAAALASALLFAVLIAILNIGIYGSNKVEKHRLKGLLPLTGVVLIVTGFSLQFIATF